MAEVKTWTMEEIEAAAATAADHEYKPFSWHSFSWRRDLCETCGCSKDRHEWGAMLRAFAAQTRQIEQMREWLRGEECDSSPIDNGMKTAKRINQKFTALFPKDGAQ